MAEVNLEEMSAEELRAHIAKAQSLLDGKIQDERNKVIRNAEAELAKLGLTLADAIRRPQGKAPQGRGKRQLKPKFRHPENPDITWSGVGRRPKWIIEADENGRLDALRIPE